MGILLLRSSEKASIDWRVDIPKFILSRTLAGQLFKMPKLKPMNGKLTKGRGSSNKLGETN